MIKQILYAILSLNARREADPGQRAQWLRDPLSHPALEGMNQRELGDLPFRR